VRMVVSELRGEKIDIIPWNPEPARFVAKALSPARVREVYIDDDTKEATVVVPDDQLALAIGKEGLNARLAARLTGWRVDIQSDTEFAQAEADAAYGGGDGEELTGRCAAILSNGKRCPNEALPGSRYCGLPAHQELALHDSEDTEPIEAEEEPALEIRSDLAPVEAESIGPESVQDVAEDAELLESEAPADVVATHSPDATEVAATEGDVDLDTVHPEHAQPATVPAGIPVEAAGDGDGQPETPVNLDVEERILETPSEGAAPGEPTTPIATTEEGTGAA
jgi:transcription termination/antitermination protein NusA